MGLMWSSERARAITRGLVLGVSLLAAACGSSAPGGASRDGGLPFGGSEDGGVVEQPDAGAPPPQEAIVRGLSISQVAIYQGIKIPIMKDGEPIERPTNPVVRGRAGMVTVFVSPMTEWRARTVKGFLEVYRGDELLERLEHERRITAASRDADLSSMFSFSLAGDLVSDDFRYRVELRETTTEEAFDGSDAEASFPGQGTARLETKSAGPRLRVVLVPMRYLADRSSREPETTDEVVESYRDAMLMTYPVPDVEMTVHEPVDITTTITGAGRGWSETLDFLLRLRQDDGAEDDVYYYGFFLPSRSFDSYCAQGCILGLSSGSNDPRQAALRGSIGVAYAGEFGYTPESTFVHEVGHAHGRLHAPCGLGGQQADRGFPYSTGGIGVWGLDPRSRRMLDPARTKDFMSYCEPAWVSDYTYRALFDRISRVNELAGQARRTASTREKRGYRMLRLTDDGLAWGSRITLGDAPKGEALRIERATKGRALDSITAHFFPYDHLPGGIVLVDEAELDGVQALALGVHSLVLPLSLPRRLGR